VVRSLGQGQDLLGDGATHYLSAVAGERRCLLHARFGAVTFHRRRAQEDREAIRALDEGADRRFVEPDNEVALSLAGLGAVGDFSRTLTGLRLESHEFLAPSFRPGPRQPQRSPGTQSRSQLTAEPAAALDVENLVDGFVGDPHGHIVGEVGDESVRVAASRRSSREMLDGAGFLQRAILTCFRVNDRDPG
jgi:hypothetical protein